MEITPVGNKKGGRYVDGGMCSLIKRKTPYNGCNRPRGVISPLPMKRA